MQRTAIAAILLLLASVDVSVAQIASPGVGSPNMALLPPQTRLPPNAQGMVAPRMGEHTAEGVTGIVLPRQPSCSVNSSDLCECLSPVEKAQLPICRK